MKILEVATVLSISIIGVGAGQNVAVNDSAKSEVALNPMASSIQLDAVPTPYSEPKVDRQIATELSMLPPIDVAPVGAFSFSF